MAERPDSSLAERRWSYKHGKSAIRRRWTREEDEEAGAEQQEMKRYKGVQKEKEEGDRLVEWCREQRDKHEQQELREQQELQQHKQHQSQVHPQQLPGDSSGVQHTRPMIKPGGDGEVDTLVADLSRIMDEPSGTPDVRPHWAAMDEMGDTPDVRPRWAATDETGDTPDIQPQWAAIGPTQQWTIVAKTDDTPDVQPPWTAIPPTQPFQLHDERAQSDV